MSNLTDFIGGSGGGQTVTTSGIYDTTKYIQSSQSSIQEIKDLYVSPVLEFAGVNTNGANSVAYDDVNNVLYQYGKKIPNSNSFYDFLYKHDLNTKTTTVLSTAATGNNRDIAPIVLDKSNNCIYIYGGRYGTNNAQYYDDLIKFDLATNTGTTITTTATGTIRGGPSMVLDEQHGLLYIYGGSYKTVYETTDSLVVYDLVHNTKSTVSSSATGQPRALGSMVLDLLNNKILIFGGSNRALIAYADVAVYDLLLNTYTTFTFDNVSSVVLDNSSNTLYTFSGTNLYKCNTSDFVTTTIATSVSGGGYVFALRGTDLLFLNAGAKSYNISKLNEIYAAKIIIPKVR